MANVKHDKKQLVMKFKTLDGKKASMKVKSISDDLNKDTIVAAMDTIISKNIFAAGYKEKDSAFIVTTTTEEIELS